MNYEFFLNSKFNYSVYFLQMPLQHRQVFSIGTFSSKELDCTIRFDKPAYVPNQVIRYEAEFHGNCTSLKGIELKLKRLYTFTAEQPSKKEVLKRKVLSQQYQRASIDSKVVGTLPIPANLLPTTFEYCVVHLQYYVQVKIILSFFCKNRKMHVPVRIGTVALKS